MNICNEKAFAKMINAVYIWFIILYYGSILFSFRCQLDWRRDDWTLKLSKSQVTNNRMNRCREQKWWRSSCEQINMVRSISGNRCIVLQMLKADSVEVQTKHGWVVQISTTEPFKKKLLWNRWRDCDFRCLTTVKCPILCYLSRYHGCFQTN